MIDSDRAAIQQIRGRWQGQIRGSTPQRAKGIQECIDDIDAFLASEAASQTNQERQADYPDAHSLSEAKRWKALGVGTAVHGKTCVKVLHVGSGYLHGEDDDKPYDVDHVTYCGRCHSALLPPHPPSEASRY